jgi:hypothetical protein
MPADEAGITDAAGSTAAHITSEQLQAALASAAKPQQQQHTALHGPQGTQVGPPAYPASTAGAGVERHDLHKAATALSTSFQRAWVALVTFLLATLQVGPRATGTLSGKQPVAQQVQRFHHGMPCLTHSPMQH